MKGIIDEWAEHPTIIKNQTISNLKSKIRTKLDYWDRQPATDDFSKGFEHANKVMREFLFGKEQSNEQEEGK